MIADDRKYDAKVVKKKKEKPWNDLEKKKTKSKYLSYLHHI